MTTIVQRIARKSKREYIHLLNKIRVKRISRQLSARADATPKKGTILFFNASTRLEGISQNAGFSLMASFGLDLAGYDIHHLVCSSGMSRCVLGTDRSDLTRNPPCTQCIRTSKRLFLGENVHSFEYSLHEKVQDEISSLNLDALLEYTYKKIQVGKIILPSLRWILRRHHLQDSENTRQLAREYILSAVNIAEKAKRVLDEVKPSAVVVFNGMFYPEAVVRYLSKERGIEVFTHEVGMRPLSVFFTSGEATAYPIDIPDTFQFNDEQEARLDAYLSNRMQGNFTTAGVQFWPQMTKLDSELQAAIENHNALVPVFTNVIFDTSQVHANTIFAHMFVWLEKVKQAATRHPQILFVIRAHPDELRPGKESVETVAKWVRDNGVLDLPNVRFINADEFVSSYELIQRAKFVMVYNSTIGLEASIMGKPVLCAGKARYTQVPTVFLPENMDAYDKKLEGFLSKKTISVPEEFVRNSRRVLFSQLFMASLPLDDFLEDEHHWKGYVKVKDFGVELLKPENSSTIKTILQGIENKEQFLLES